MATQKDKTQPPTTTEDAIAAADQTADTTADEVAAGPGRVVPVHEGPEVGYVGRKPRETPNEAFTVAGVTGGTANVEDVPTSAQRSDKA